jgi:hypothetical protein
MIPQGGTLAGVQAVQTTQHPSRTYGLNMANGRIVGMIDGLDAVKQSVLKILLTERFENVIYSFNYGSEFNGLIGMDRRFIEIELTRRIREALTQDDRIKAVQGFTFTFINDEVLLTFTVVSQFGNFLMEKGVRL